MGLDRVGVGSDRAQLGAQGLHVRVHGAVDAVGCIAPDRVHQLVAAADRTGARKQGGQQQVLIASQGEPVAGIADALARRIVLEAQSTST